MNGPTRRALLGAAASLGVSRAVRAAPVRPIGIGVLTDLSGPYRDLGGQGSIAATRLAGEESGLATKVLAADHRNDPAVAQAVLAQWFDHDGIDIVVDVPNSAVALAVRDVVARRNKTFLCCGAGTTHLAGDPHCVHWSYDTTLLARGTGTAVVRQGGSRWFLLVAGYEFGRVLAEDVTRTVQRSGGRVEDVVEYAFPHQGGFAPLLAQAVASPAGVLGLCNAGEEAVACVRAAREAGLAERMRIAALLLTITDVAALTLDVAQGLLLTETFYWDLNDRTRAFTRRLMERQKPPAYPNMIHAGCYAATRHALRAAGAAGTADGAALVARMHALPTDDDAFGRTRLRDDGTVELTAFLFTVKSPDESAGPWDVYRERAALPPTVVHGGEGDR